MAGIADPSSLGEALIPVKARPGIGSPVRSWARLLNSGVARLARFYVNNRRDGSRLLSSALVICAVGLIRIDHPVGQVVSVLAGLVSLYWWLCYRQLSS